MNETNYSYLYFRKMRINPIFLLLIWFSYFIYDMVWKMYTNNEWLNLLNSINVVTFRGSNYCGFLTGEYPVSVITFNVHSEHFQQ